MHEPAPPSHDYFSCSAEDPSGTTYFLQVVPVFGAGGPTVIASGDPTRQGPVLRFVNRLLVMAQPTTTRHESAMLIVTRDSDQEDVLRLDVNDSSRGRTEADLIAQQISSGTFDPARYQR